MAIKEFFKNLGQGVKKATNKAVTAIDDTVDVQKLKYRISKKEDEIKEIHRVLGETIVNAVFEERDFDEDIAKAIAKIAEIREELEAMNAERIQKEGKVICPECGAEVSAKCDYCPKCGYQLKVVTDEDKDAPEEVPENGSSDDSATE